MAGSGPMAGAPIAGAGGAAAAEAAQGKIH
jgi:hypothetical protein